MLSQPYHGVGALSPESVEKGNCGRYPALASVVYELNSTYLCSQNQNNGNETLSNSFPESLRRYELLGLSPFYKELIDSILLLLLLLS